MSGHQEKYKHIVSTSAQDLDSKVNEHIAAGWVTSGTPYVADGEYHQCMVVPKIESVNGVTSDDAATLALLRKVLFKAW